MLNHNRKKTQEKTVTITKIQVEETITKLKIRKVLRKHNINNELLHAKEHKLQQSYQNYSKY